MAKKKEENKTMTPEERNALFEKKLKELLALAKSKKNVLEYQEISDPLRTWSWTPESFERSWIFSRPTTSMCSASRTMRTTSSWTTTMMWIWSRLTSVCPTASALTIRCACT